jgi:hypothetical protein
MKKQVILKHQIALHAHKILLGLAVALVVLVHTNVELQ